MKKLMTLMGVALLAGCSIGWIRPGGTEMESNLDRYSCEQQATQMYPQMMVQRQVGGGYETPSHTKCHGDDHNSSCVTYPGHYIPPEFALEDANTSNRNTAVGACMRSKGYEFHMGFK